MLKKFSFFGLLFLGIGFIFAVIVGIFILPDNSHIDNVKINVANQLPKKPAKVTKVIDGDTIRVLINNKEETVRLIGIDSPEVLDERKPIQCFGIEASDKAKEVLTGKIITLEPDATQGERDEYGRLLRYVFLDNLNFNELMLDEGYAREYAFKGRSYKYRTEFIQAEKKAREKKICLWADRVCDLKN